MQLAHPADDGLAGLLVAVDLEGGVLLGQRLQGPGQLVLVVLGLGLDGHVDDRLREVERLEHDRGVRVAQGVARGRLLQADEGHDVAGEGGVLVLAVVGVHLQDAPDPLLAVLGRVEDGLALGQLARVDPDVGQLADVGIGHDLERQRREGLDCRRPALELLDALDVHALGRRDVDRARQEVDDGVEHGLHALVLERRAAQHGHHLAGDGGVAQRPAQVGGGDLLVGQELVGERVVEVGQDVDQPGPPRLGVGGQVGRDLLHRPRLALVLVVAPLTSSQTSAFIPMRSTTPRKSASTPIGICTTATVASRRSLIMSTRAEEVGPDPVHLVDEADPRDAGTCRPGARPSRSAARRRRRRRTRRRRRRAPAGCAPPRR